MKEYRSINNKEAGSHRETRAEWPPRYSC